MARRAFFSSVVLVAVALLSCAPRPDARVRFLVWAKYVSREARNAGRLPAPTSSFDEFENLSQRLHISDRDLKAILAEAQVEKWAESPDCQPGPEPYRQNALLLGPEPIQPIEGRQTSESCSRHLQGVVIIGAVIRANGAATDAMVVKSIDPVLDQQAATAVGSTPWRPALLCAQPVDVHFSIAVSFHLSSCNSGGGSPNKSSERAGLGARGSLRSVSIIAARRSAHDPLCGTRRIALSGGLSEAQARPSCSCVRKRCRRSRFGLVRGTRSSSGVPDHHLGVGEWRSTHVRAWMRVEGADS